MQATHERDPGNDSGSALDPGAISKLRHDLRTPINHIIGYGEMLLEDAEAAAHDAIAAQLRRICETASLVLEKQNHYLTGSAEALTLENLSAMRDDIRPMVETLDRTIEGLQSDAAGESREYLGDTLARLEWAARDLRSLIDAVNPSCSRPEVARVESARPSYEKSIATPDQSAPVTLPGSEKNSSSAGGTFSMLVVDDNEENRTMLSRRLVREGYRVETAPGGFEALDLLEKKRFDLLLLDVMMEGMSGVEVLERVKSRPDLKEMPVIMISALDEIESVVRCIEMGAEDYLPKPFNPVLLRARIGVALERKRLRDEERAQQTALQKTLNELEGQKRMAEEMLLNVLPAKVARDLQADGAVAPMYFEDVTIGFTDFVGFTLTTEKLAAEEVVSELHARFTAFDEIVERYGLEKLKTIGDSYMFASGLPTRCPSNPINAVLAAIEMLESSLALKTSDLGIHWGIRIGLHTGPVIAGVVGIRKFAFDIWGDAVNFASRMESSSEPNRINISDRTYARVKDFISCQHRGRITTKDGREADMYFVNGVQERLLADLGSSPPPLFQRRFQLYFQQDPPSFPSFLMKKR
jgi:adenylate cyclase